MAHRQFTDSRNTVWEVWEVEPSSAERRAGADRRRSPRPGPDRRRTLDSAPRVRISSEFTRGWLCFQSVDEKRRLAPVPDGWELLEDVALENLLARAVLSGRPRRLIE